MSDHGGDASQSDETAPGVSLNRRTLLRAGAGGRVLAASGFLLPEWLHNEARAREAAYGGVLGGRHGRNRRGKEHHRRRHNRGKGPDRSPPRGFFDNEGVLNIKFIFLNNNDVGTDPIGATCYSYKWDTTDVVREETKESRPAAGVAFDTTVKSAILFIDHDRAYVWAKNPYLGYPTVVMGLASGGSSQTGPADMQIGTTLTLQRDNYRLDVKRIDDDSTSKIFTVTYKT